MVFRSYIPQQQEPPILRKNLDGLGYVCVDIGDGFEQFCKCNHRQCVDLFARVREELNKSCLTRIKETLERKKSEYKLSEKITPENRSLVTFFRHKSRRPIGQGGTSGLTLSYLSLLFVGDEKRYQELLTNVPELELEKD